MKSIPASVIQGLVAANNGETVAGNYVKLQEGWSLPYPEKQGDGSVKMHLSYSVLFFDRAENKYYSITQGGTVLSMDSRGHSLSVRQPFKNLSPDFNITVVESWPEYLSYPTTIMTERPPG